jgi:hypothetical protein
VHRDPSFSLHDFKNWLSGQSDLNEFFDLSNRTAGSRPGDEMVGCEVYAKVSTKKLMEKIEPEEGDAETLIEDLVENGGMVLSVDGKNLLVEVETGSFLIPRFCVRLVTPE